MLFSWSASRSLFSLFFLKTSLVVDLKWDEQNHPYPNTSSLVPDSFWSSFNTNTGWSGQYCTGQYTTIPYMEFVKLRIDFVPAWNVQNKWIKILMYTVENCDLDTLTQMQTSLFFFFPDYSGRVKPNKGSFNFREHSQWWWGDKFLLSLIVE